ncbi:hypothetical protein B0H13DRAFT_1897137 [Mycena leptocephala]|nr:hypothetical protein B0H13DRAFT_1897137 [Mycena leptocephala]
MYPTNFHDNSVYTPKPTRPGAIRNEHPSRSRPTRTPLGSILGSQKNQHMPKREIVWPFRLETALLEGRIFTARPTVCKETVMLGRYPGRNQFLSEYILNKTGEQRTPKQVGSRLQQLRDSRPRQELRDLLFPNPYASLKIASPEVAHRIIFIDIVFEGAPFQPYESSPQPWSESKNVIHVSRYPRRLSCIDPTVTFTAPVPIPAQSWFTVYTDDGTVHTESGLLTAVHLPNTRVFLHSTVLVPSVWKKIVESPGDSLSNCKGTISSDDVVADPTCYMISHQVTKIDDCVVLFSATYAFRYPRELPPQGSAEAISAIDLGYIFGPPGIDRIL